MRHPRHGLCNHGLPSALISHTRRAVMRAQVLILFAALALLAGCNKGPDNRQPASRADTPPATQPQTNTPSAPTPPASAGQSASQDERKEGANPTQGQVDPKAGEQHRDFQQKGDDAGPKGPDTAPKSGG